MINIENRDETLPASAEAVEPKPLDPDQVKRLRDAEADWQLLVKAGDQTCVVTRKMLRDIKLALNPNENNPEVIRARPASSAEELLTTSAAKLLGPESSWERIKGGVSLPVTQAALIGSAAGLFGLGALKDKAVRPGLLAPAVLVALVCVVLSLLSANRLGTVIFKPSRLDLLRDQYNRAIERGRESEQQGSGSSRSGGGRGHIRVLARRRRGGRRDPIDAQLERIQGR